MPDTDTENTQETTTRRARAVRRVVLRAGRRIEVSGPPDRETR